MNNLSNVLQLFSTNNNKSTSIESFKSILKSDKQFAKEVLNTGLMSSVKAYNSAREDLRMMRLISIAITQSQIDRNRKINSLKAMKTAGASMEQLANIAGLYALEGFGDFVKKVINAIKEIIKRFCAFLIKIVRAIFGSNKQTQQKIILAERVLKKDPETIHEVFDQLPESSVRLRIFTNDDGGSSSNIFDLKHHLERNISINEMEQTVNMMERHTMEIALDQDKVQNDLKSDDTFKKMKDLILRYGDPSKNKLNEYRETMTTAKGADIQADIRSPETETWVHAKDVIKSAQELKDAINPFFVKEVEKAQAGFQRIAQRLEKLSKSFSSIENQALTKTISNITEDRDTSAENAALEKVRKLSDLIQQFIVNLNHVVQEKLSIIRVLKWNVDNLCDWVVEIAGHKKYKEMTNESLNYSLEETNKKKLTKEDVKKAARKYLDKYIKQAETAYKAGKDCELANFSSLSGSEKDRIYRTIQELKKCDPDTIKISSNGLSAEVSYTKCSYGKKEGHTIRFEINWKGQGRYFSIDG